MDLGVDRPVPAVVAIDLHRGHLDPAVATMPLAPDRAGPALHDAALACIRTAFGVVMRSDEIHKLRGLKK
jgi:hypothetical protein